MNKLSYIKSLWKKWGVIACVTVVCFFLDTTSKIWAQNQLNRGLIQPFLPGLIQLTLTTNTGGAFGIGKDYKELVILLSLLIFVGIVGFLFRREATGTSLNNLEKVAFAFVLGGASGNIWDRLSNGQVTDFLEFTFIEFPVFNLADVFIDIGIVLMLLNSIGKSFSTPPKTFTDKLNG